VTTQPHLPWSWRVTKYLLDAFLILMVATQLEKVFHVLKTEGVADVRAFNGRLVNAVHNFSPFTLGENFAYRLDSEHGRRVLSFRAPFNMTAARARVDARFPRAVAGGKLTLAIGLITLLVVVHVIGVPLTAPETTVVMTGGASFPISWATQKIVEHVVTDRTLRAFHQDDE
jgi:hypothetical protein